MIALVALDILEVLHEEAFVEVLAEPIVEMPVQQPALFDQAVDEVGLRTRECDDADTLFGRSFGHEFEHDIGHAFGFPTVRSATSRVIRRIGEVLVPYAGARRVGTRKGQKPVLVERVIREANEALAAAPVVHGQVSLRDPIPHLSDHDVEDALATLEAVTALILILVLVVGVESALEEGCGWELEPIADDNHLAGTLHRGKRILR